MSDSDPKQPSIARVGARGQIGKRATAGNVKPWLPPRQSRGASLRARAVGIDLWRNRRPALAGIGALGLVQEAVNVAEAYLLLTWLGAAPAITTVIVFEGATRVVNTLGQFVPGRMGVSEASSALVAGTLSLTPAFGLSLALARRARSLIWAIAGLSLLALRTVVTNAVESGGGEQRRTTIAVA